jgi:LmbE family N-acetylglucosaminyl deacetylase
MVERDLWVTWLCRATGSTRPSVPDTRSILRREVARSIRAAKVPARAAWRSAMLRRGTDITPWTAGRTALVLAPHPDDETIGCGATIARKRALGTRVRVVVVCDGRSSHPFSEVITPEELAERRGREVGEACERLGVPADDLVLLGHADESIATDLGQLACEIEHQLELIEPDELYLPSPLDWHVDHVAVNQAARIALGRAPRACRVVEYPVWYWADGPWQPSPSRVREAAGLLADPLTSVARARPDLVSTAGFLDHKRAALAAYETQTRNLTGEDTWASLPPSWFEPFLGDHEVFLPVAHPTLEGGARPARRTGLGGRVPAPTDRLPAVERISDRFIDATPAGEVLGSVGPAGALRLGRDAERRLSIDHGALRMPQMTTPGWGRESLVYGPVRVQPGRTLTAFVLNGHNTSQSDTRPEGRRGQAQRLAREAPQLRLQPERPVHTDNLAIGWFTQEAPADPLASSHAFVMHAATVLNGELRVGVDGRPLPVHRGVQNLPMYYVVVLREQGAIYFAASCEGAAGVGSYPDLRPVGIDPNVLPDDELFVGVHQCVLGEVGYRVATRVYGIEVTDLVEMQAWCTSAVLADRLDRDQPIDGATPERGRRWHVVEGEFESGGSGLSALSRSTAVTRSGSDEPIGLIHVLVDTGTHPGTVRLVSRADGAGNGWGIEIGRDGASIDGGPPDASWRLEQDRSHSLQLLDDGNRIGVHLDGDLVFGEWFEVGGPGGDHVAVHLGGGSTRLRDLEAHPRAVPLPPAVDLGAPWLPRADTEAVRDDFAEAALVDAEPTDLAGTPTSDGRARWERVLGTGRFLRRPRGGVDVDADLSRPCPGRTLYTVEWADPAFAELEIEAVPPGEGRGDGHAGRAGVVFWQDADNHLVVNPWLDDYPGHDGSSVSAFLMAGGAEDMYDAVWSNVGREVHWGRPYRLRVAFDGVRFLARINDQPVLYRAITDIDPAASRFEIRRVGIATNWEWGDDTGSRFDRFVGRTQVGPPGQQGATP